MEKQINTRVLSKIDTQSNWDMATEFIPRKGEIIIYSVDSNYSYPRFKVGDGITSAPNLPFQDKEFATNSNVASAINSLGSEINKSIELVSTELSELNSSIVEVPIKTSGGVTLGQLHGSPQAEDIIIPTLSVQVNGTGSFVKDVSLNTTTQILTVNLSNKLDGVTLFDNGTGQKIVDILNNEDKSMFSISSSVSGSTVNLDGGASNLVVPQKVRAEGGISAGKGSATNHYIISGYGAVYDSANSSDNGWATSPSEAVRVYSPHNPQIIDDGELE